MTSLESSQEMLLLPQGRSDAVVLDKQKSNIPVNDVTQRVVLTLLNEYGYNNEDIEIDFPIATGWDSPKRIDIAVFPRGANHSQDQISIIFECKTGGLSPNSSYEGVEQLKSLMLACSNCRHGVLVGIGMQVWRRIETVEGKLEFLLAKDIPCFGEEPIVNCEDNLVFMNRLEGGQMKLIVTSPPYNLGKRYEIKYPLDDYLETQKRVIQECVRLLHPQGSLCWQVGNYVENGEIVPLDIILYPIFNAEGLQLRNRIIWHFGHGLHSSKRLSGRYETIMWWTKSDDYTWNLDPIRVPAKYPGKRHHKGPNIGKLSCNPHGKNPSDVWEFPNVKSNHPEKTLHPCQFPVELAERLVLSMTNQGDKVFDPYMGVGSSVVAALMHNRTAFGCDIVDEYVKIAWQRVGQLKKGTLKTRPMGKPIYDPNLPKGGHG